MKIQIQTSIDVSAKAVYRDGEVIVTVTGSMPLAPAQERNVQATVGDDQFSDEVHELFLQAFEQAIEECQAKLAMVTQVGQAEALSVASRMGEL